MWLGKLTMLNMTLMVDCAVKPQYLNIVEYMSFTKRKYAFGSCDDSEGPDQTAQMCSLIRAFTVR